MAAQAQDTEDHEPPIDLSANVGVVSDYRFRGISLSDRKPAIQGGIDLKTRSGLFVGTWVSSIAEYGGAKAEVDAFAGYGHAVAGFDLSVGAYGYFYPGGQGVNYVEFQSTIGLGIGKANAEAEVAYVPEQQNVAADNIYAGVTVTAPLGKTPLQLKLRGGFEHGFYERKWDWEAGLSFEHGPLAASLSVVGSNQSDFAQAGRLGRTGVLAGISATF